MEAIAIPIATAFGGGAAGAIAASVAVGAVTGAVIGAATAALTGGNILKGALRGAAIGGITAGVISGAGIATGLWSAESQLATMGVNAAETGAAPTPSANLSPVEAGGEVPTGLGTAEAYVKPDTGLLSTAQTPAPATPTTPVAPVAMSDAKAKIYAGIGEGAFKGLGQVGAAKMEADNATKLREWEAEQANLNRATNIPGQFTARVANVQVPNWWEKHLAANKYLDTSKGLLAGGTA